MPDSGLDLTSGHKCAFVEVLGEETKILLTSNQTMPAAAIERRKSIRFPIEREVHYKTLNQRSDILSGRGQTLNISSSGVLFLAEHDLPVGTRVELSISWPVMLNERCLLKLVVFGRVTRGAEGRLALQVEQYEFRTQAAFRS